MKKSVRSITLFRKDTLYGIPLILLFAFFFICLSSIARPVKAADKESLLAKQLGIPTYLKEKFSVADGWVSVIIEADIGAPNAGKIPVAEMEPADFSQEVVSLIYNKLCGGYEMFDPITSSRITDKLVPKQQQITQGNKVLSYETTGLSGQTKDHKRSFHVANNPINRSLIGYRGATMTFMTDRALHNFSSFPIRRVLNDTSVPKEAKGKLTLTPEKAREQVESLIKGTGLMLTDMYLVDDANVRVDGSTKTKNASRYAYRVYCGPAVNGVGTSALMGTASAKIGPLEEKLWLYESMEIFVDDKGVFLLYWNSPCKVTSVVQADAKLLAFSEIKTAFKEAIAKQYGSIKSQYIAAGVTSYKLDISHISLSLQRVHDGTNFDQAKFIPVWNFYGAETRNTKEGRPNISAKYAGSSEGSLLCINAIDGSVVSTR